VRYFLIALAVFCASCTDPYSCDQEARRLYPGRKIEVLDSDPLIYVIDGRYAASCTWGGARVVFEGLSWTSWKEHWCGTLYQGSEEYLRDCATPKTPEKAP